MITMPLVLIEKDPQAHGLSIDTVDDRYYRAKRTVLIRSYFAVTEPSKFQDILPKNSTWANWELTKHCTFAKHTTTIPLPSSRKALFYGFDLSSQDGPDKGLPI